jgi:hypothetical protein
MAFPPPVGVTTNIVAVPVQVPVSAKPEYTSPFARML